MAAPTGILFYDPRAKPLSTTGQFQPGCYLKFYTTGTTTLANVYADGALTTPLSQVPGTNPPSCTAASDGRFVPIYMDPTVVYRVQLYSATNVLLEDTDPFVPQPQLALTQAIIGGLLYPPTPAEQSAGVTIVDDWYPPYDVRRYGASPTASATTNTTAFNRAFLAAGFENDTFVNAGPGIYALNGTLTIDTNKVGFNGNGCFLDCTGFTSGNLWNIIQSDTDSFFRVARNQAHPLRDFVAQGPNATVACKFVDFNDASGLNVIAGIIFENGGSMDWQTHVNYGVGAYFETFRDWDFSSPVGSLVYVNMPGALQSGENNVFDSCRFASPGTSSGSIVIANSNSDTTFDHCKFDAVGFSIGILLAITGGTVRLTDCHMESSVDAGYWVSVTGFSSSLFVNNLQLVADSVKTAFAPFYCDSSAAGISFGAVLFGSQAGVTVPLVDGTGPVRFTGPLQWFRTGGQTVCTYIAASLNVLADGGFESGSFSGDAWTVTGGTPPVVNTTNPHTGTHAASFSGVTGQDNSISFTRPCLPGQVIGGAYWAAMTGFTTGTVFSGTLYVKNEGGGLIQQYGLPGPAATAAYAKFITNTLIAPPGTTSVEFQFSIFGTTTGTPIGYLDDVILTIT